ncbi:MAG: hypothetical protein EBS06_05650 [Proteobacteria bacterium]|nr:hypothetical protein [Pseudomonadota bacterium]
MKRIILVTICFLASAEVQAGFGGGVRGSPYDLYNLPIAQVERLLVDCEKKYYPEYYATTPFPERYHALQTRQKLHYCMRKLMQTGDFEEDKWYRIGNINNGNENRYEQVVGHELPDEYYLIPIENYSERMEFLGKGMDQKYAEDEEKRRQELKKKFGWAANIVGFFNPILGGVFTGVGAAQ